MRRQRSGELRREAQILADAATVEERVEGARVLGVRAVGRRCALGRKERREIRGLVVDHVVDAVRRRRGIEHALHGLRDVGVVAHRHALGRRKSAHEREHLADVWIAVAVYERQPEHTHVETFDPEEEALRRELAHRICRGRCAGVVLAGEAPAVRAVDQAGAREDKALHRGTKGGGREALRAEIVDGVRSLGSGATEERSAVDYGVDAAHRGRERARVEQIALHELDARLAEIAGAREIAHEGADLITALGKSLAESASDLSGRAGHEDLHVPTVPAGGRLRLEETDKRAAQLAPPPRRRDNRLMHEGVAVDRRLAPSTAAASAVSTLLVFECEHDAPLVSIPRPEIQLVVRFGPSTRSGLDVHAMGVRRRAHRKLIRRGQRTVTARLRLGVHEAVLGVPASTLAGRVVPLEDLWGDAATRRLLERLADAETTALAAAVLESAIAERVATADKPTAHARLVLDAADKLTSASVSAVAVDLGVSERHLRRIFHETVGVSPKAFAKLARFHRALRAVGDGRHVSWAGVAADAGYYDQAHLIAEFRAIAGATPKALLGELDAASPARPRV